MTTAFIVTQLDRVVSNESLAVAVCVTSGGLLNSIGTISIIVSLHSLQFLF
jgi:hypothetical protein